VTASASGCVRCGAAVLAGRCAACGVAAAPGGYRVERVLAEDEQGRVYLARAPLGFEVELRELLFPRVPEGKALAAFAREAQLLRSLRHRALPEVIAHFSEGDGPGLRLYLAQRRLEGRSLEEELAARRYGAEELRAVAREALAILAALQERPAPIFHRDVQPKNLLRTTSGVLCLTGFASARHAAAPVLRDATVTGSLGYAAPEQLAGEVDATTDVYGLAATLVHLAARRPPWELLGPDRRLDLSRVRLPPGLRRWLERALHPDPRRRFSGAREALEALEQSVGRRRGRVATILLGATAAVVAIALLGLRVDELWRPAPDGLGEKCPPGAVLGGTALDEQFCLMAGRGNGVKNVKHGPSVKWESLGDGAKLRSSVQHYKDGLLDGLELVWHLGLLQRRASYRAGQLHGPSWTHAEHGTWVDGQKDGPWVQTEREVPAFTTPNEWSGAYERGEKTGVWRVATPEGRLVSEIAFAHDKPEGKTVEWYPNGMKRLELEYRAGRRVGLATTWREDGRLSQTATWKDDEMDGLCTGYDLDGAKEVETVYARGKEVSVKHFRPDGSAYGETVYASPGAPLRTELRFAEGKIAVERGPGGAWVKTLFDEKGRKRYAGPTADGQGSSPSNGPFREWDEAGALLREGQISNDKVVGALKTFWPGGALRMLEQYNSEGRADGLFQQLDERGHTISTSWFLDGAPSGSWAIGAVSATQR